MNHQKYIKLNNGVEMPMVGIGTFLLSPDEAETSVASALEAGYRLIDTAAYVNENAAAASWTAAKPFPWQPFMREICGPDEENVSDDISEALMWGVIRDLRLAIRNPEDYTARSNLMWESTMAENRIIKLGKRMDFECHQMEYQLGADESTDLKAIADSCNLAPGSYKK